MHIMRSPLCDDYISRRSIVSSSSSNTLAKLFLQCDEELLHSLENNDHSRFLPCNNCDSHTASAVVQSSDQRFCCLCQTCVSNANKRLQFCNDSINDFRYFCSPDHVLDFSSLSPPSSFIDQHLGFPFVSPPNNGDSSSSLSPSEFFQNFDNFTKNLPILHPDYIDIPKDSSCSSFDIYQTKEENVWFNTFDGYKYFPGEDLIFTEPIYEIPRHIAESPTEILLSSSPGMSSVHKDYSIDAMANATPQDYNKNQMIIGSSKANEQTNNLGTFPKALVQLDYGTSLLILTDEMLPREDQTLASKHQARQEALKRYFAKKKNRKFGKQIRYESRKSTADTKRRMKGRFTKAGAEYDFDPRANYNKVSNKIMTK